MGMFDYITCKFPLPSGYEFMQSRQFQTKSLDCWGLEYAITEDGLLKLVLKREPIPEEERAEMELGPLGIPPIFRMTENDEAIEWHGDVVFYDFETERGSPNPRERNLIEFVARFTEGRLSRVWVLADTNEARMTESRPRTFKELERGTNEVAP